MQNRAKAISAHQASADGARASQGGSNISTNGTITIAAALTWPVETATGVPPCRRSAAPRRRRARSTGSRQAGDLRQRVPRSGRANRADHHRDAAKAEQDADELAGPALVVGEGVRDDHAPDRRGRIQDRGEAADNLRLRPGEEAERDDVVEQGEHQQAKAAPGGSVAARAAPAGRPTGKRRRGRPGSARG